ncbi:EpsG family protein [Acinetobacter variabilis]|uniref:EpsG family protein n=1 Tax=Acinetobacter variabilis TaxID=70346 RepID=UPI0013301863|nr:EpsG family protein [Acinetobacter variabilis]
MLPYLIFIIFILFGLFFLNKKYKFIAYFIFGTSIILLYSLRDYSVGTDTLAYIDIFQSSVNFDLYNTKIEPLFIIFNYILYHISNSIIFYFLVISLVFVWIWIKNIDRLVFFHKDVAWLVLVTSLAFLSLFNITRQSLAMAMSILAFSFLVRGNNFWFLILSILSIFSHYSAVIIFLVFLFLKKNNNPILYLITSFILTSIFSLGALDYISGMSTRYSEYSETSSDGVTGIMLIALVSLKLILFYLLYFIYFRKDLMYRIFLSLFSVGFSLLVVLKLFGFRDEGPLRIVTYFLIFDIFLFPYFFYIINNVILRIIFKIIFYIFMIFLFSYGIYSGAGGLYPYIFNEVFILL